MSVYDYDTLAYHAKERPGTMLRDISHVPLKVIGKAVHASLTKVGGQVKPEREAISFYLLNHAMHEIGLRKSPDEPLGAMLPIVEQYHHALNSLGYRLFNYLMCITTREMRHLSDNASKLESVHGSKCVAFSAVVKSKHQSALWESSTDITVGEYLNYLLDVYNKLKWGGALGGKKWGVVTKCLHDVVFGKTTIEQMLDTGYTLQHNTCSIFNKGMHYSMFGSSMLKILDCQRGGQIPNLVRGKVVPEVEPGHINLLDEIEAAIPGFKAQPWVNWALVEKLGAEGSYGPEQSANDSKYGHLPAYKQEQKELAEQVKAAAAMKAAMKAADEASYIEIMPGVKLKKGVAKRG